MDKAVLASLAGDYPQLFLDPDRDSREAYRRVVLQGGEPESHSLEHYAGSPFDREELVSTPAGAFRVVTLGDRGDFERVLRGLLAAKNGPEATVPSSQGASMLTLFNWPRIRAHLAAFPEEERGEEFRRFTAVKANYTDMLVLLSRGPYSGVAAAALGRGEEEWLALSDTIRRCHELCHGICRRQYPGDIQPIRDELIADAVGLYAAFGRFDPETEKLFLGIRGEEYVRGRLENYSPAPEALAPRVSEDLAGMEEIVRAHPGAAPFDLIGPLMEREYACSARSCGEKADTV